MDTGVTTIDTGNVACEVCLKEIPPDEAGIVEANDYVLYFCGLDCYRQWRATRDGKAAVGD
jgi:hypothetical protein